MKRAAISLALALAATPLSALAQPGFVPAPPLPPPPPADSAPAPAPAPAPTPAPATAPTHTPAPATAPAHTPAPAPTHIAAPAPAPPLSLEKSYDPPEGPPRQSFLRVAAGVRIGYVPSRGFDAFSSNDVLPQLSLDATYTLFEAGRFSFAAGLAWDVGGRSSGARDLKTSITVHRLTAPLEGRWHLARGLYAFGRIAPGAASFVTRVEDASAPTALEAAPWVFAADASLGASVLLGPRQHLDRRGPRVWVTPEVGYGFTTKTSLSPGPDRDEDDVLGSDASAGLGQLTASAFFWRASVAMTF